MKANAIYINLPAADLIKTRAFWSELGCTFNEQFSNDQALCLVLNEGLIYVMLVSHELFHSFTNRSIAEATSTQVITAVQLDSREVVDELVGKALNMGATRYREAADHGWMYYDSFADLDGHQWEFMYLNNQQVPD
jgi:predicted lactoylglutathione lyase